MKFGRDALREVEGYTPGEQPKFANIIKLNTNENPYPPSPKVLEALSKLDADAIRRYPDPVSIELRRACAVRYGLPSADWIIAGNGMDELLAMTIRTFSDPGDAITTPYPTYVLYETLAKLHGAKPKFVDLDDNFQLTPEFYSEPARIRFIPRPNSPSGVCAPRAAIERLCAESKGLVFIDEAYADFAEDSCIDLPRVFDNVIVGRTFSKAFSLAGMRVGVAIAQPALIQEFMKTKDSYNLSVAAQHAALAAFNDYGHMLANVAKVRATRTRLVAALRAFGFSVPDSQANFVLAQWAANPSAREVFTALRERAIVVRYFDAPRLQDSLRISVGTEAETDALLRALEEILP